MLKENLNIKAIIKYILVGLSMIASHLMSYEQSIETLIALSIISGFFGIASIIVLPKISDAYTIGRIALMIGVVVLFSGLCTEIPLTKGVFIALKLLIDFFSVFHIIGIGYAKLQQLRDWFHRK